MWRRRGHTLTRFVSETYPRRANPDSVWSATFGVCKRAIGGKFWLQPPCLIKGPCSSSTCNFTTDKTLPAGEHCFSQGNDFSSVHDAAGSGHVTGSAGQGAVIRRRVLSRQDDFEELFSANLSPPPFESVNSTKAF